MASAGLYGTHRSLAWGGRMMYPYLLHTLNAI